MSINQFTYQGVQFTLVHSVRGWAAYIPRFGSTMYFPTRDEAIDEAVRLLNAFRAPRLLRQAG